MQQQEYEREGFVFPVAILSRQEAEECYRRLQDYESRVGGTLAGDNRFKLHLLLPWVWDLVHHPRVIRLAQDCLRTQDVWCWSTDLNVKEPQSKSHFTWHQDATYAGIDPPQAAVTIWLALTPSTEQSGCVQCIPRSHERQLSHLQGCGGPDNVLSLKQEVQDLSNLNVADATSMILQPGEASVHSFLAVHASGPNTSHKRRIGLAMRFVSAHAKKSGSVQESATLVSGQEGQALFVPEVAPQEELGKMERERHAAAMELERQNYLPQGGEYR